MKLHELAARLALIAAEHGVDVEVPVSDELVRWLLYRLPCPDTADFVVKITDWAVENMKECEE